MARISGIDLPNNKRIEVALTYVFGIGNTRAKQVLERTGISPATRVKDLTDAEETLLRKDIEVNYRVEGELRRQIMLNIKRLKDISSYRGVRHQKGLPVRGQRTKTNARTRKGKRKGGR